MTTGEAIKKARIHAKMTQKELGNAIGVSYQHISQYERGIRNPKYDTLQKIADVLKVEPWELMGYAGSIGIKPDPFWTELQKKVEGGTASDEEVEQYIEHEKESLEKIFRTLKEIADMFPLQDRLDYLFNLLNKTGQQKAVDYVEDLSKIEEYQKKESRSDEQKGEDNGE